MSLRTAMAHRNLLYLLSLKELRTRYKKSVLGWAWSLLNPISQMLIFTIIFTYVFGQNPLAGDPSGLKNFPLYFLCGLLPWNFFAITTSTAMGNVQNGDKIITAGDRELLPAQVAEFRSSLELLKDVDEDRFARTTR